MKVTVLASGSKGNCTYLEGDSGALIIDSGISTKEMLRRLELAGGDSSLIKAILVTHEHIDHIYGIDVLAKKLNIPVIATQGTLWQFDEFRTKKNAKGNIQMIPCRCNTEFQFEDFKITPFPTFHDALDPCGFKVTYSDSSLGFCTDTGHLEEKQSSILRSCDTVVLESNHCPIMLKNGRYPEFLKARISDPMRGHLSNTAAGQFIKSSCGDIADIILAHLSEENNTPKKALDNALTSSCDFCDDTNIHVSLQREIADTVKL